MVDPLFLQFCLWFVFNVQKYLSFSNRDRVFDSIFTHVLEKFDVIQIDSVIMGNLFPVFNLTELAKVLKQLTKTQELLMSVKHPTEKNSVGYGIKWKFTSTIIVQDETLCGSSYSACEQKHVK